MDIKIGLLYRLCSHEQMKASLTDYIIIGELYKYAGEIVKVTGKHSQTIYKLEIPSTSSGTNWVAQSEWLTPVNNLSGRWF